LSPTYVTNTRAITPVAILATLLVASRPLVLAQQQEQSLRSGEMFADLSYKGTEYASPEDARTTANTLVSPEDINPNDSGALQYDPAPDPAVPPGYQKVGDSYCPIFDPLRPPRFRVP